MLLKFSHKESNSPVAYCALTVKSGTRDEDPKYNGLAHFTEHMLFKGTLKRKSGSINACLEKVGGELNAYTTKEETVLHSTVLAEDISKAIDLLFELAFTSTFPQKELEKERDVVLDEIVSYKDMPGESIYEHFEQLLFEGSPLNMQILGEKKTLSRIDTQVFLDYIKANFRPDNMALTVVCNMQKSKIEAIARKALAKYCGGDVELEYIEEGALASNVKHQEASLKEGKKFDVSVHKKSHQAHCMIGTTAFSCYSKKRIVLAILTNILGGPASGALLNNSLREKHGLVYNVEAVYTPYADNGIFSIYYGCDKEDVERCKALIKAEIDKLVSTPLKESVLKAAKKQLIGQMSIAQDNNESQCLSMGKSLVVYGKISDFEQMKASIEAVSAQQLQEVAKEVISWDRMSFLVYN